MLLLCCFKQHTHFSYVHTYIVRVPFLQILLECGSDPRMHADDGAVPEQVCAQCVLVSSR